MTTSADFDLFRQSNINRKMPAGNAPAALRSGGFHYLSIFHFHFRRHCAKPPVVRCHLRWQEQSGVCIARKLQRMKLHKSLIYDVSFDEKQ